MAPKLNIDRISLHNKGNVLNTSKCLIIALNLAQETLD